MKNHIKRLLIFYFLLSGSSLIAQQKFSVSSYLQERNTIIGDVISKKITVNEALARIKHIHALFEKKGFVFYAQEENLYSGFVYILSNRQNQGIELLKNGLEESINSKNDTLVFKYTALIADTYREINQVDSSEYYFQSTYKQLIDKTKLIDEIPNEVIAFYNNYSFFLEIKGEFELRKVILEKSILLANTLKNNEYKAAIEYKLAIYYLETNKLDVAEEYFKASIFHTQKAFFSLPRHLRLCELYLKQNRWSEFIKHLTISKQKYLEIKGAKNEFLNYELQIYLLESKYQKAQNNILGASKSLQKAIALTPDFKKSHLLAQAYIGLGDLSIEKPNAIKQYNAALKAVCKTENLNEFRFEDVLFPKEFLEALGKRAAVETPTIAIKTYEQAISFSTHIRKSFANEESKYFYEERLRPLFGRALQLADGLSPTKTFDFIEYSKAAVLNEVLLDQRIKYGNVAQDLLQDERQLQQQLTQLLIKLEKSADQADTLNRQIRELQIKQGFLKKRIEKESPNYYELKYNNRPIAVEAVQKLLTKETAVVSYFRAEKTLYIAVVTKDNLTTKSIHLLPEYQECLKLFKEILYNNPGFGRYSGSKAGQCLYGYLIKPIEGALEGKKKLIVIRDAELNLLPFEVLEPKPHEYLLSRFSFSYNYAASLLPQKNNQRNGNVKTLSFAPYAERSILENPLRDRSLGALPFSKSEVEEIGGEIYRDDAATKQRFLENYRENAIIHFATHAQIDDIDPDKSFIAFYPDSTDYKLYTRELYNLSLQNTKLVVLSACEAGRGKIQGGEGMLSLARAFAYAGCPAVITTLWNAHDESSAFLSERVHAYLKTGLPKDEALQKAKLDFMNSDIGKQFDHPYYWANFIVIGDTSPVYEATNWWIWGSIVLVGMAIWYLLYKKKSKV